MRGLKPPQRLNREKWGRLFRGAVKFRVSKVWVRSSQGGGKGCFHTGTVPPVQHALREGVRPYAASSAVGLVKLLWLTLKNHVRVGVEEDFSWADVPVVYRGPAGVAVHVEPTGYANHHDSRC
nr:hypothetical protein [Candidatus Freyrarchaeum guaymaensis]